MEAKIAIAPVQGPSLVGGGVAQSGDRKMLDPVSGLLDQKSEDFAFEVKGLTAGEHTITVRVSDQAGNTAAVKGVVQIK